MKNIFSGKSVFLASLLLLSCFLTYSQNILEGYWGVKGGFNINKISGLRLNNTLKPGFHIGLFANFQLNDRFSMQHEILYSQRGVSVSLENGARYTKTFSYIDLPWTLNYYFNRNFYITAGVQPSVYAYFKSPQADSVLYNKDNVNTIDFSYLAGAAFLFDNNFGFGVRFNGSIVPLFEVDRRNKNYVLQLYVMYAINKRKGKKF